MPDTGRVTDMRSAVTARVPGQSVRVGTEALRRGVVSRALTADLDARDAHLARVLAVARTTEYPRVFSHLSAAAIWGLPLIGRWPNLVEYLGDPADKGRSPGVRRRRTERPAEPQEFAGLWLTSLPRTVIDLARELPLASALAAADHVLHEAWCAAEELRREADAIPAGHRGRRRAALVSRLADPLNESVGESLSRARMFELRVPRPQLQVVRTEEGDRVDYFWPHLRWCGEFDGKFKYGLLPGQTGAAAADVLFDEKRREDRLRAVGDAVGRWVWDEAYDLDRFDRVMRRLGLVPGSDLAGWPSPSGPETRGGGHHGGGRERGGGGGGGGGPPPPPPTRAARPPGGGAAPRGCGPVSAG